MVSIAIHYFHNNNNLRLDASTKGLPIGAGSVRLGDIGAQLWNVRRGDMSLPILILRDACIRSNLDIMRRYANYHGVLLAPHGKTTCCPQLYHDQVSLGGAWGLSAATVEQAALIAASGITNVLLANQVVGSANVKKFVQLLREYPATRFLIFVDSRISRAATPLLIQTENTGRRLEVLVEAGYPGSRSGVRTIQAGAALVDLVVRQADLFKLVGVGFYEGLLNGATSKETIAAVTRLVDSAIDLLP